jgi:predicted anti-sigma-YlaC factor YlaD
MHEQARAHLEDYLARGASLPERVTAHLESCFECRAEWESMASQSVLLRSLRATEQVEPRPGFYARVLDRIDAQRPFSIWSIFLEPAFGPRLAIASAVLALIMGVFLVSGEPMNRPAPMQIEPASIATTIPDREDVPAPVLTGSTDQEQVRNAVFVSLATYRE